MATPMRDLPVSNPPTTANFEYDDNEWDIGIGDLIIDLDADIEKTGVGEGTATPKPGKMHSPVEHRATVDKGLKMKIKRTKPGTKHEIVKSGENGDRHGGKRGSGHRRDKKHSSEKSSSSSQKDVNGMAGSSGYPSGPGPPSTSKEKRTSEDKKSKMSSSSQHSGSSSPPPALVAQLPSPQTNLQIPSPQAVTSPGQQQTPPPVLQPPLPLHTMLNKGSTQVTSPLMTSPNGRQQSTPPPVLQPAPLLINPLTNKEMVDECVGTSIGTITEPDCLGPCEPGTSVTLEGIVWHETEGVLVVNVTWRGKTYVGTLLDCTRHDDWAPPRFCDSPTSDIDARLPKGRGKRGRATSSFSDLSNFTETRSSVHSKLRSNSVTTSKGKKGTGASSPTSFATPKVETPAKRKSKTQEEEAPAKRKIVPLIQPMSPTSTPTLLECPEPNCSKKYKHINGLKYHQSHAHGSLDDEDAKESGMSEEEEPSPISDSKKDDLNMELSGTLNEESQEEKSNLIFAAEDLPIRNIPSIPSPLSAIPPSPIQTSSTPPPPSIDHQGPVLPVSQNISSSFKVNPCILSDDKSNSTTPPPILTTAAVSPPTTPKNKKKIKKSPNASPEQHSPPDQPPNLGIEVSRDEIQSPAYSDISDDTAPLLESEVDDKPKLGDKKDPDQPQLQPFNMYQYYNQPPYLVPSIEKPKDITPEKLESKISDKEKKDANSEYQHKLSQHYYQYGYVPGYSYNMDTYPVVIDDKKLDDKQHLMADLKQQSSVAQLHIPNPNNNNNKQKNEAPLNLKEKHQNENHQILKESIEMKNQMNPSFMYQRTQQTQQPSQSQQPQQSQQTHQPQTNPDDLRRYYMYSDRKDPSQIKTTPPPTLQKAIPTPSPKHKDKDDKKDRRDDEKKQEGVKPTMETQGPPPPPTSQYAYIHPGYMQSPHYGTLPFDPNHPMYRSMNPMLVSGYTNSPYLHPQLHTVPRYHAPEDLSRSQSGKALDLLQHHASQYYSHPTHKIHELQERAIKSPTPKTSNATSSPSVSTTPVVTTTSSLQIQGKPSIVDASGKDGSRSPPPQRHVHTHHHTHVGLGYPILPGQYPAPYGAAVLASEHASAVTSVPYQSTIQK